MALELQSLWDIVLLIALIIAIAPWFGAYLGKVYMDRPLFGDVLLNPIERAAYRVLGTSPRKSMRPGEYMLAVMLLSGGVFAFLYLYFFLQAGLPLNATGVPNMTWDLAFHSAASFTTNTDYTHFTNESQMSMGAELIAWQLALFTSTATGLSVAVAMIRGFVRRDGTLGNFYVDMVRTMTRVLIPLATIFALVFVLFGVPETLRNFVDVTPLNGGVQTIYLGPVASFQSMSLLGSNGGGWYAANAASPLANPSAASNLFMTGVMMLIPFSTPFAFQQVVRKRGEAWPYMGTILIIFVIAVGLFVAYQAATNPALLSVPNLGAASNGYPIGEETRFSLPEASLFQVASVYSNVGANNLMIGSVQPVAQMVLLFGMFTQSTPGGVGGGFGTLLLFAVLAIFIGGLMVGRTPEYLGKKIGTTQVKWAALALLIHPAIILIPFSVGVLAGAPGIQGATIGASAHNFTSVLYELTSEAANNGSALSSASFNDTTMFWNVTGAIVMIVGRFVPFWAMLQVGGLFAEQETLPPGPGTLKTASLTFTIYLTMILIIISTLLFLPVIALGPLAQIL
ncbi:MAG TPA: potassium-transporting ATPase subunit KdpA [Thermoplasmata archaeon]|jgi:potassium-transporting ATPase potassium-binding subunit|nr:potassium-transporting ATPase subunit KdpA [Thermoplasmata archaeon]